MESKRNTIYELLKKGHRVHIFFNAKKRTGIKLKDHINIRYFALSDLFFGYTILFKLWERRRKKKVEFILVEGEDDLRFFKRFAFLHDAKVLDYGKSSSISSNIN